MELSSSICPPACLSAELINERIIFFAIRFIRRTAPLFYHSAGAKSKRKGGAGLEIAYFANCFFRQFSFLEAGTNFRGRAACERNSNEYRASEKNNFFAAAKREAPLIVHPIYLYIRKRGYGSKKRKRSGRFDPKISQGA
jgi:hypothetical protein